MAVYKVLSETDGNVSHDSNAGRYSDFVLFLSTLAARFSAAKVLADTMGEATGEIVEKSITLGIVRKDVQKGSEVVHRSKHVEEAELLDCVAKMVDLSLSTNGKNSGK